MSGVSGADKTDGSPELFFFGPVRVGPESNDVPCLASAEKDMSEALAIVADCGPRRDSTKRVSDGLSQLTRPTE